MHDSRQDANESERVFTPPPIRGYRPLTQTEVNLMNLIKGHGADLEQLLTRVQEYHDMQRSVAGKLMLGAASVDEEDRLDRAQPERWRAVARTHFQQGLMALTRSVAQPEFL